MANSAYSTLWLLIGVGVVAGLFVFSEFRKGRLQHGVGKAWFEGFAGLLGIIGLIGMVFLLGEFYPWVLIGAFWGFVLLVIGAVLWDKRRK